MEKIIYKFISVALIPGITVLVMLGIFVFFTPVARADNVTDIYLMENRF